MKKYLITQSELYAVVYEVEGVSGDDASDRLNNGEGVEVSKTFIEHNNEDITEKESE